MAKPLHVKTAMNIKAHACLSRLTGAEPPSHLLAFQHGIPATLPKPP